MTSEAPLAFPEGGTLADWWRKLSSWQPQALWVGHLFLHRIEALVQIRGGRSLAHLDLLLLKALRPARTHALADLEAQLRLGPQFTLQLLRSLARTNLAEMDEAGRWSITRSGIGALGEGSPPILPVRRVFHFLDDGGAVHFVHLRKPATVACPSPASWQFQPQLLEQCTRRPENWKRAHGFPLDVEAVALMGPDARERHWRQVMIDRSERLSVAMILTGSRPHLQAFTAEPGGWNLDASEPVFSLGAEWTDALPSLRQDAPAAEWRQTWQNWCKERSIPAAVAAECVLERHQHRLDVIAGSSALDALRRAGDDLFKDTVWVLAGTGNLRQAALLHVVEVSPS